MAVEIETLEQLDAHLARVPQMRGLYLQSLDLTERGAALRAADVQGAVFLGCTLPAPLETSLRARGALVFPTLPSAPVNAYRATLYTAAELYDTLPCGSYAESLDGRVYAWVQAAGTPPALETSLVSALHDHAIGDALDELVAAEDRDRIIGLMGGHAAERGTDDYRAAAELGRSLARSGRTVLSGGGPGAMEAANLGAWMAAHPDEALDDALATLASVPSFRPSVDDWARAALAVQERWPAAGRSIGVPTWFYGHEPPNLFATHIAKYFSNALREDTLLALCRGGLVYLPGAAGTVQELFQAVTGNYYAEDPAKIAPLVLVGTEQWTTRYPAWPLLKALSHGRAMSERIGLVADVGAAAKFLGL